MSTPSSRPTLPVPRSRSTTGGLRIYTPSGTIAWATITKIVSGVATAIGVVTFIVGLGIRYGELQLTVTTQTKEIEALKAQVKDTNREQKLQNDRLTYAIKQQNDLIVNLRIAVAASAAADEVRRGGTYNRVEILGAPPAASRRSQAQQARNDALNALDRTRNLDPLAGLEDQ